MRAAYKKPVPPGGGTQGHGLLVSAKPFPPRGMDPRGARRRSARDAVRHAPRLSGGRRAGTGRRAKDGNGSGCPSAYFPRPGWTVAPATVRGFRGGTPPIIMPVSGVRRGSGAECPRGSGPAAPANAGIPARPAGASAAPRRLVRGKDHAHLAGGGAVPGGRTHGDSDVAAQPRRHWFSMIDDLHGNYLNMINYLWLFAGSCGASRARVRLQS